MWDYYLESSMNILNSGRCVLFSKVYEYSELCRCVYDVQKGMFDYSELCKCENAIQKGL